MDLAPMDNGYGVRPASFKHRMRNMSGGALAKGDVCINSYTHSGIVVTDPISKAEAILHPYSCVLKADGNGTRTYAGFLFVATEAIASGAFGEFERGECQYVKVVASGADVNPGDRVRISNTPGQLTNAVEGNVVGVAMGTVNDGATGYIKVILPAGLVV